MRKETIKIPIPPDIDIDAVSAQVSTLNHVEMEHPLKGKATPPDGDGMSFEFELQPKSRTLEVTVVNRPKEISLDYVHGHLISDMKHKFAGYAVK